MHTVNRWWTSSLFWLAWYLQRKHPYAHTGPWKYFKSSNRPQSYKGWGTLLFRTFSASSAHCVSRPVNPKVLRSDPYTSQPGRRFPSSIALRLHPRRLVSVTPRGFRLAALPCSHTKPYVPPLRSMHWLGSAQAELTECISRSRSQFIHQHVCLLGHRMLRNSPVDRLEVAMGP